MSAPKRSEITFLLEKECKTQNKKILGLKNLKLPELKEAAQRLGIDVLEEIRKLRIEELLQQGHTIIHAKPSPKAVSQPLEPCCFEQSDIPLALGWSGVVDDIQEDETTDYFNDKTKREPFIGMFKKDYTENKEKNRMALQQAKGNKIKNNTFNHNGIIIMYGLLPECAEEEDFSIIIQHFNIKVRNGEVTYKG
jgi:hypothetical protein